jgi:hypothetical protein
MARILERAVDAAADRLVLLAPEAVASNVFQHVDVDVPRYRQLVHDLQRMRGQAYLADGAITPDQLTDDGLHRTEEDERAWHILSVDADEQVTGCAWYLEHPRSVTVSQLRVRRCPLARAVDWRPRLWSAVNAELRYARTHGMNYVEVGGWAVSDVRRTSVEGLLLALAGYSLGRLRGGCLGMTTATVRHCSSTILRRIGGAALQAQGMDLPSYYDPRYRCEMEILRFDSRQPSDRYRDIVDRLCERLMGVEVVARVGRPLPALHVGAPLWAPAAPDPFGRAAALAS